MSFNIMECLRLEKGLPAVQQTDPDLQIVEPDSGLPDETRFLHAAIPSILTALYRYSRGDEGAAAILNVEQRTGWADHLFGEHKQTVIDRISGYSYSDPLEMENKLNELYKTAVLLIRSHLPEHAELMSVKKFMSAQQMNILPYLPPNLRIGAMLDDDTYDDDTHKMNDFFSNLMHSLGNQFSADERDADLREHNI